MCVCVRVWCAYLIKCCTLDTLQVPLRVRAELSEIWFVPSGYVLLGNHGKSTLVNPQSLMVKHQQLMKIQAVPEDVGKIDVGTTQLIQLLLLPLAQRLTTGCRRLVGSESAHI